MNEQIESRSKIQIVRTAGRCVEGDCGCQTRNGAWLGLEPATKPPPYHDGCTCYLEENWLVVSNQHIAPLVIKRQIMIDNLTVNQWKALDHHIAFRNFTNLGGAGISFAIYTANLGTALEKPDPIAAGVLAEKLNQLEEALALWREWFKESGSPICAGEAGGDLYCFFCSSFDFDDTGIIHEPDCIYLRAKELVGDDARTD